VSVLDTSVFARSRTETVHVEALVAAKGGQRIGVCIPARNEAATIASVVEVADRLRELGLVDELLVVDDGSEDATASEARATGASVVASPPGPGKGEALRTAVTATDSEIVVFLDADVTNFSSRFVTDLVAPLLHNPRTQLVKATYRRSLDGRPGEGGRVNELVARPLLRRFFPQLATLTQPLAGECAVRRAALDDLTLAGGYGVEIGLVIDVYLRYGLAAIGEVDLGERIHRNRPLRELRPHADDVLAAVLARIEHTREIGGTP
jgi:glucosyl-3-phosphoglycerate synthase